MRVKTWKALSKFLIIYIFILFFQVAFPKAAYAFLSSVDTCAANPECAAVLGAELAPSVAAPTGAGSAATISVTTATEATTTVEAASGVAVVAGDMRLSGVVAYYIWGQLQNPQAQDLAKQKYCTANPNDAVCLPPFTGGQCPFTYKVTYKITWSRDYKNDFIGYQSSIGTENGFYGPIYGGRALYDEPHPYYGASSAFQILSHGWKTYAFGSPYYRQEQPYYQTFAGSGGAIPSDYSLEVIGVEPQDGQPDSCGNPPPLAWKDWPQEKRDAAVQLISPSDWQAYIPYLPKVGPLNPGDTINAPKIVIPGQETDDPNTPEDERLTRILTQPYTWPGGEPLPSPSPEPSPEPSPSPSPDPSPSPSPSPEPSPSAPTASGNSPSPSPDPSPSPPPSDSPDQSPSPSPQSEPLNSKSVVIDSNVAIALNKAAKGQPLNAAERAAVNSIAGMGDVDIRETDTTVAELERKESDNLTFKDVPLSVDRSSPDYQALLQQLENNSVGGKPPKGQNDRSIVADTFLAETEPGVTPKFVTQDKGVYTKLLEMAGTDPAKLGKSAPEAFPNGFNVTVNGRTIHVIPLPKR